MVTLQEISEIRNIVEHNDQCSLENAVYVYKDWHSTDGQIFAKIDDGQVIKVNGDGVINNLGVVYLLNRWLQEEGDYDEKVSALLEMEDRCWTGGFSRAVADWRL
jgi:hypothetical protein